MSSSRGRRAAVSVLVACALAPGAPARAADSVIATALRPTPVEARGGNVLFSAWDPDAGAYRLTLVAGGVARPLPIAPASAPFEVDLGPGPDGADVAVYPRCARRDCDLYRYDIATGRERRLAKASSAGADETSVAVWRDRIVFERAYRRGRAVLYTRRLSGSRPSRAVTGIRARDLDLRGSRIVFSARGRSLWVARTWGGAPEGLADVSGSEAIVGPTATGRADYWMLTGRGFSEIHRFAIPAGRDERVRARVSGAASGFAADGDAVYYAVPAGGVHEIHRADGLAFEPAP